MTADYRLFYDDAHNAISCAIDNNVHGLKFKEVAYSMWPALKPETAYARLKACINPEKPEKLDLEETRHLCQITGRYEPLYWLCDVLSHTRPAVRAPQDRQAELIEQFIEASKMMERLGREISANGGPAILRKVGG